MAIEGVALRNKNKWIIFCIKGGVIIFIVISFFIVLNYFQIIPLAKFFPNFIYLPVARPSYLNLNENNVVNANSQREDYSLKLNQPDVLLKYFSNYNILTKGAADLKSEKSFEKAIIVLTNERNLQHKYAYTEPFPLNFAYQVNGLDDTMVIFIYVSDSILMREDASALFGSIVLQVLALYSGENSNELQAFGENSGYLFTIKPVVGKITPIPTMFIPSGGIKPKAPNK